MYSRRLLLRGKWLDVPRVSTFHPLSSPRPAFIRDQPQKKKFITHHELIQKTYIVSSYMTKSYSSYNSKIIGNPRPPRDTNTKPQFRLWELVLSIMTVASEEHQELAYQPHAGASLLKAAAAVNAEHRPSKQHLDMLSVTG